MGHIIYEITHPLRCGLIPQSEVEPFLLCRAAGFFLGFLMSRIPEQPSVTMPGTVDKIIPSSRPRQPEKVQIAVDGADDRYRDLRIENMLIDENGDEVKLKEGEHVELTVTTEPGVSNATINDEKQTGSA